MKKKSRSFGSLLRAARERAGLTQTDLAGRCKPKVQPQRISALEQGDRENPRFDTIKQLAEALEIPIADLVGEKPAS